MYDKRANNTMGKEQSSFNSDGKQDSYMQKNKPGHYLVLYTKVNSEWIKDLKT